MIEPNDPLDRRIWGHLLEKLPLVAYTFLVALLTFLLLIGFAGYRGDVWIGAVGGIRFLVGALYLKSKCRKSKVTEAVTTLLLLSDFVLIGVSAW